jgi:hypothetical protein
LEQAMIEISQQNSGGIEAGFSNAAGDGEPKGAPRQPPAPGRASNHLSELQAVLVGAQQPAAAHSPSGPVIAAGHFSDSVISETRMSLSIAAANVSGPVPGQAHGYPVAGAPLAPGQQAIGADQSGPATAPPAQHANAADVDAAEAIVERAVERALSHNNPTEALQALNVDFKSATPAVQKLILQNAGIQYLAKAATAPLTGDDLHGTRPQARADAAIGALDKMTRDLDPRLAGAVAEKAAPVYLAFYHKYLSAMPDGAGFGSEGVAALVWLSGRIGGTPQGNHAISDFVTLSAWNTAAVVKASSAITASHRLPAGAENAYTVAYAKHAEAAARDTSFVLRTLAEASMPGTLAGLKRQAAESALLIVGHQAAQTWTNQNVSAPLAELEQKARGGFLNGRPQEWKEIDKVLRARIAEEGATLLKYMLALDKIARETGLVPSMLEQLAALADDPASLVAIEAGIEKYPDLAASDAMANLLERIRDERSQQWGDKSVSRFQVTPKIKGWFAFLGVRLTNVTANAYLRLLLKKTAKLDSTDPASAAQKIKAIKDLGNGNLGRVLGVSGAQLDELIEIVATNTDLMAKVIPLKEKFGDWEVARSAAKQRFDNALSRRDVGLNETEAGQKFATRMRLVFDKYSKMNLADPAVLKDVKENLARLQNKNLPRILGVTSGKINFAVELLKQRLEDLAVKIKQVAVPLEEDLATMAQLDAKIAKLGVDLARIESEATALNRASVAGKLFRGIAFWVSIGINLKLSAQALIDDPSAVKALKTGNLLSLAVLRTCDSLASWFDLGPNSIAVKIADLKIRNIPAADVLVEIYGILEAVNAGLSLRDGDYSAAVFSGLNAIGFGFLSAPAFGASVAAGPVGMGILAISLVGQMVDGGRKEAHKYEEESAACLKGAGFNDFAAGQLSRRSDYLSSEPGKPQMPFLAEYARFKHISMTELRDWINTLTPDQVQRLSNNVLSAATAHGAGAHNSSALRQTDEDRLRLLASGVHDFRMAALESMLARDKVPGPKVTQGPVPQKAL